MKIKIQLRGGLLNLFLSLFLFAIMSTTDNSLIVSPLAAQIRIQDLPRKSPSSADIYPFVQTSDNTTWASTLSDMLSGVTTGTVISCTYPLRCDGGASHNLSSSFALSYTSKIFDVTLPPYNAVGDGVTNDTAAFTGAIAAAQSAGRGVIYVPRGVYLLTPGIAITSANISIRGDGYATRIVWTGSGDGFIFGHATTPFSYCGGIRDLVFDRGGSGRTGFGIVVDGCDSLSFSDLTFLGGGSGIGFCTLGRTAKDCNNIWLTNIYMVQIGASPIGMKFAGGNDRFGRNINITGGENDRTSKVGMLFTESLGDRFVHSTIEILNTGVEFDATGSAIGVNWITFTDFENDANNTAAFYAHGTGSIQGLKFIGGEAGFNGLPQGGLGGSSSSHGYYFIAGSGISLDSIRALGNGGIGVEVGSSVLNFSMTAGEVGANGAQASGTLPGVRIGASGWTITGTHAGPAEGGANTQTYGIEVLTGADNYLITGADTRGNITGGINNVPGPAASRKITASLPNDTANDWHVPRTRTITCTAPLLCAGAVSHDLASDFTLSISDPISQSTTGSAAKWTTARNLAGNSVDGSANVAFSNKFIVQGTSDSGLSAAQFLGSLSTGILKNTTTTGVLSIAVAGDFPTLNQNTTGTAAGLSSTLSVASGGTNLTSAADDSTMIGNGTTWQSKTIPDCTDSAGNHLNYTQSSNTLSCGTSVPAAVYQGTRARVSTQFDKTSDTTLANVTGLTANVSAGQTYGFTAVLFLSSNSSGGVKVAIGGTATATSVVYWGILTFAGTFAADTRVSSIGSTVCAVTAVINSHCVIEGTITVNAGGTLTVQFAQNASFGTASSVLVGSRFYLDGPL